MLLMNLVFFFFFVFSLLFKKKNKKCYPCFPYSLCFTYSLSFLKQKTFFLFKFLKTVHENNFENTNNTVLVLLI